MNISKIVADIVGDDYVQHVKEVFKKFIDNKRGIFVVIEGSGTGSNGKYVLETILKHAGSNILCPLPTDLMANLANLNLSNESLYIHGRPKLYNFAETNHGSINPAVVKTLLDDGSVMIITNDWKKLWSENKKPIMIKCPYTFVDKPNTSKT